MKRSAFNESTYYSWETTTTFLGICLQSILLSDLDDSVSVDSLMILPSDFVLGRNLWDLSFIHNIGTNFPIHQHSQVGYYNNGYLPGALSPGPVPSSFYKHYELNLTSNSQNFFNSDSLQFNDDYSDFLPNEPTFTGNATALVVFGYFSKRLSSKN